MDHPETMRVIYASNPSGGLVIINVSDYDPAIHKLEGEKPKAKRGRPRKTQEVKNANDG